MRVPLATALTVSVLLFGMVSPVSAGHVTDVASAFDKGNLFDFNLRVGYGRTLRRGAIKRELVGKGPSPQDAYGTTDGVDIVKDLRFSHVRHVLSVRAEASIFRDLMLHLEFPIILGDTRSLSFAQNGGDSCGAQPEDNCVTVRNSTLIRDRFFPKSLEDAIRASSVGGHQVDIAGDTKAPNKFYLPNRSGLDQMHLGITWAPINQRRDPTKPTWVLGFEARISVGEAMAFNPYYDASKPEGPLNPKGNTSVGQGLHQLKWWTAVSKRYKYIDPWISFFYLFPTAKDSSLFKKTTFNLSGQEREAPQQRGGVEAGMEIIPWEQPKKNNKFTIELRAKLEGVFEGRGYSELWEVFANNPILAGPCRPSASSISPDMWNNGTYCGDPSSSIPFPGITTIENHAVFKAGLAFNLDFSKYFRARLGLAFGHEQQHYITFTDAGRDANGDGVINYDAPAPPKPAAIPEKEVNPMYRPYIDLPGQRWRVGETTVFDIFVSIEGRL